jgi:hypothetical protein
MVTYWRQPGDKTMKRQTSEETKHVPFQKALFEIALFRRNDYRITDHGHKIVIEKDEK